MDIIKMLIEFGAPIEIDESEEKPIEITGYFSHTYLETKRQVVYVWKRIIDQGPRGLTIRIERGKLPYIRKDR